MKLRDLTTAESFPLAYQQDLLKIQSEHFVNKIITTGNFEIGYENMPVDFPSATDNLPIILNSKPGVHATQQGGGDGDSRISIRGFDQRNIGVMIDGVPVNDMENGAVYWSNWFGLDAITEQIQIQRGLGATKLAMPSVGGTMNIITDNTGGKR